MQEQKGNRSTALLVLNLGDRWGWVVNATPWPLCSWTDTWLCRTEYERATKHNGMISIKLKYNSLISLLRIWQYLPYVHTLKRPRLYLCLWVLSPLPGRHCGYSDSLRAGQYGVRTPVRARISVPVQTGPGSHLASYTIGTESFPRVKRPGRGADHPPYSSARVEYGYSCTYTCALCLLAYNGTALLSPLTKSVPHLLTPLNSHKV
jgi:hypothetical protein